MSRLLKVRYTLKGQQREVETSPVVLVTGPNGSGKSTLLLAVSAGLWGLAQSPTDPVRPYIGPERGGSVELVFDAGIIRRDLSQGGQAKDAQRATLDAERIAGAHLVRWDLADFASVSDTNREKLLRSICGAVQATALKLPESPLLGQLLRVERLEQDAGTWLERSLKWAADRFTEFNAAQKTAAEGAKAAGEAAEKEAPPGTLSGAKAELERLQAQVAELRAQAATAQRDAAQAQRAEADRQRAAARYAEAEKERDALTAQLQQPAPDLDGLKAALEAAEIALAAAVERNRAAGSAASQGDAPHKILAKMEAVKAGLEGQIAALEGQQDVVCAHCGHADPLAIGARIAELRRKLEGQQLDIEDAQLEADVADRHAAKRMEAYQAASAAELSARDAYRVAVGVAAQRGHLEARRTALEAEMGRLTATIQAVPVQAGGFASQALLEGLEEQLVVAMASHDAHVRCAERGRVYQEALIKRTRAEADFVAIKQLKADLQALQADVAAKAWGPLQTAANELLAAMGSPLRASVRSAADFGATDARRDGGYASFWALSDAERATVGAALALAMVRLSNAPWRALVIDGLEKMDEEALEGFLCGVVEAQKQGWIDNFVGALVANAELEGMDDIQQVWMGVSNA